MTSGGSVVLVLVGVISGAIALLQFVMYAGGRRAYYACGTPEDLILFREEHPVEAFLVEAGIAGVFATFAAYAFSAAGAIAALPFLPYGLALTAGIYLCRGMWLIPQASRRCIYTVPARDRVYSAASALIGAGCGAVTYRHWPELVQRVSAL